MKKIDALKKISELMVLPIPLSDCLEKLMDIVLETTQTDAGSLLLIEGDDLVFKVAKGEKKDEVKRYRVKIGTGIAGCVAESGESIIIPDVNKDERFYKKIADDIDFKTYNIMASPIKLKRKIFGVIEVINKLEKGVFTHEDLDILETISYQTALLLENDRLKEETEKRAKAFRSLIDVGLILNATHRISDLLDVSMRLATKTMSAEASSIMLIDELTDELVFEVVEGEKRERIKEIRLKMGEGVAGWVAQNNKPLLVRDVARDERFAKHVDESSGFKTKSIIAAPLRGKTRVIGVIEIINKIGKEAFEEDEIDFLILLANQIALAVENAKLYSWTFGEEVPQEREIIRKKEEKKLIGEILNEFNLISDEDLKKGLAIQKKQEKKKKIGEILVEDLGVLTEDALNCALSHQLDIPYVTLTPSMIDKNASYLLPYDFLKSHFAIPIMKFDNELSVVMTDPLDKKCIEEMEKMTGYTVKPSLGSKTNILDMLSFIFESVKIVREEGEEAAIMTLSLSGKEYLFNEIKRVIDDAVKGGIIEIRRKNV
ncbi:TPA: hypothetical protein DCX16_04985 [bacterium]|nr:hypothetical protein [bacterium]